MTRLPGTPVLRVRVRVRGDGRNASTGGTRRRVERRARVSETSATRRASLVALNGKIMPAAALGNPASIHSHRLTGLCGNVTNTRLSPQQRPPPTTRASLRSAPTSKGVLASSASEPCAARSPLRLWHLARPHHLWYSSIFGNRAREQPSNSLEGRHGRVSTSRRLRRRRVGAVGEHRPRAHHCSIGLT